MEQKCSRRRLHRRRHRGRRRAQLLRGAHRQLCDVSRPLNEGESLYYVQGGPTGFGQRPLDQPVQGCSEKFVLSCVIPDLWSP